MCNLNEATLIGRLGKNPEVTINEDKPPFATFNLATNESWKHGDQLHTHTEWHRVEVAGSLADYVGQHLLTGDTVFVRGHLRTRKWVAEGVNRSITVIKADKIQLLRKSTAKGDFDEANSKAIVNGEPIIEDFWGAPENTDEVGTN